MKTLACLNGEIMPVEEAKVPVWDRGFLFGDSIYEVFRLYGGKVWLHDEHHERLRLSLSKMHFEPVDPVRLDARILATIEASGILEGIVYIQITRGVAPRAHAFPKPPVPPTELIIVKPYDDTLTAERRQTGVSVMSQPDLRWGRCDVKSTNLLANVIALETVHRAGAFEAVFVDRDGLVTESTHSSLIWVRNGKIEATPDGPEILPGTKRHLIQDLAASEGIHFVEARATLDQLIAADEVILTGTTIEVMPVIAVDGQAIGSGQPGPVARTLQSAYRSAVERFRAG